MWTLVRRGMFTFGRTSVSVLAHMSRAYIEIQLNQLNLNHSNELE